MMNIGERAGGGGGEGMEEAAVGGVNNWFSEHNSETV